MPKELRFVVALLVAATATPAAADRGAPLELAQNAPQRTAPSSAQRHAQAAQPAPAPAVPSRTEILNFDNWTVTCREFGDAKKRECSALLQLSQTNSNQTVLTWTFGTENNKPMTVLVTPTGVMIAPGVELKLDKVAARKLHFTACDNGHCTAAIPVDGALVRDIMASANAEVTIQALNGQNIKFMVPLKGFDKAYAALR